MTRTRFYPALLRLYPRDYRAMFAAEMLRTLETSGRRASIREIAGLTRGALTEWFAKLTTDRSVRGRALPDIVMMRPPGVTWEQHFGPWPKR